MKTTYFVWKNPSCNGIGPEWRELTGKEFTALVRSPEAKGRYFINLPSTDSDGGDGAVVIEATETEYRDWKCEKNHADYLRKINPGYTEVHYLALDDEDGDCGGEELLRDENCDVEAECLARFAREEVRAAVLRLSDDERRIVEYLYLSETPGTVRGYEELTGIPKTTVNRRQQAALSKLKKFLKQ